MEAATETPTPEAQGPPAPPPRLRAHYGEVVAPALAKKFGYSSPMSIPRLLKVTVNMGIGEASTDKKVLEEVTTELGIITGQKPNVRRAKKSVAAFKIRDGMPVGAAVTLRRARMWEFVDRLVTIATPRIRDFRGYNPRAFDGRGNFSLGVREQLIFPEIDYDSITTTRGLDIAVTTTAETDEEAFGLLLGLGFPFAQEGRPGSATADAEAVAEAEEEERKEEARQRAEAEQAALEELKEENPEAYEKPEPEEGEEGEGDGESAGGEAE